MTNPSSSLDASPYRTSSPLSIPGSNHRDSKYTVRKKIPSPDADKSTTGKTINAAQIITPEHSPINSFPATFTEKLFEMEIEKKPSKKPHNGSEGRDDCGLVFQNLSKPKATEFSFIDPPGSLKNTFITSPDNLKASFSSLNYLKPSNQTSMDDPVLMHGKKQVRVLSSTNSGSPSYLETPPAIGNLLKQPVSASFGPRSEKPKASKSTDVPTEKTSRSTTSANHLDLFEFEL